MDSFYLEIDVILLNPGVALHLVPRIGTSHIDDHFKFLFVAFTKNIFYIIM